MSAHSDPNTSGKRQAETQESDVKPQKRARTQEEELVQEAEAIKTPHLETLLPADLSFILDRIIRKLPYTEKGLNVLEKPIPKPDQLTGDVLTWLYLAGMVPLYRSALATSALQKKFEETDDTFHDHHQAVMHGKKALSPSEAAKKLASEQQKHPMAIGRPFETTGPSVSIYHPVFSEFKTLINDPNAAPPEDVVTAFNLIQAASKMYDKEDARNNALRPIIEALLHRGILGLPSGYSFIPDGIVWGDIAVGSVPLLIVEAKNEIGAGGSDPNIQGAFSFRKFWVEVEPPISNLQNACCCPTFVLSVAGPHIALHGAILAGQFIVQPLTETLGLANFPNPYGRAQYIAKIMVSLRHCLDTLDNFYKGVIPADTLQRTNISPIFRQYDGGDGEKVTLTYTGPNLLSDRVGRALFNARATRPNDEQSISVKVKFTTQYCQAAHALLAESNLAPKLRHCEKLDDDWIVVVMDSVAGIDMESAEPKSLSPSAFEDIERAMGALHGAGWVFGDLRPPNIMLCERDIPGSGTRKGAMLVDFDWAGKENEQRYPPALNPEIKWPEGVVGGGIIKMEHDDSMLELLKAGKL
ncbi:hypothetical protein M407DRAFT_26518 [Tulasnella calospora MUT 4182]|uniref:Protein kinase domain-containing protein n=1 Tax=Tulasnella calospora MUT 4182 TaxID=1051891 RepID=A0A0C3LRP0_9AGAM|nr:hypothetical protein M407DRAFT_26518 [Tulasnella calospora MUT 4182]